VLIRWHFIRFLVKYSDLSSHGIDIQTKGKRGFDPQIFSIQKQNECACSKVYKIEEEQMEMQQNFSKLKAKQTDLFQKV